MAYVHGIIKTIFNGAVTIEKYLTIWERIDGNWKLTLQMRNSNK